jgi:hypothetical protein
MGLLGTGSVHYAGRYSHQQNVGSNAIDAVLCFFSPSILIFDDFPASVSLQRSGSGWNPAAFCQKCLQKGHFIYECTNERAYVSRPTRTQQLLNPKVRLPPVSLAISIVLLLLGRMAHPISLFYVECIHRLSSGLWTHLRFRRTSGAGRATSIPRGTRRRRRARRAASAGAPLPLCLNLHHRRAAKAPHLPTPRALLLPAIVGAIVAPPPALVAAAAVAVAAVLTAEPALAAAHQAPAVGVSPGRRR